MKKNSFIEGTIIATVAIVLVKILGMLYVIPFYATVGTMGAALYAYAYNIYNIVLDISSAGIPVAISKLVSEFNTLGKMDAKKRTFAIGKKIISFMSVAAFIILFLFAKPIATLILGDLQGGNTIESVTAVIRCVSFAVLVIPYLSVSKGYLQGHNFIAPSSVSQIIEQVVRIAFILIGSYLALNVFNLSMTTAVGVAVFGAFVGGISALMYIYYKMHKNKEILSLGEVTKKDDVSNKEIAKRIVSYAIPFIIINTAVSIYNFMNMVFILRTMNYLGYEAAHVEFVTTAITTWSPKIQMIITALATGMTMSLIPSIVESFTKKNWAEVSKKLNKALQMILIISIPMAIGISMLATPVWNIFYTNNSYGHMILAANIFTAIFNNLYIVTNSVSQGLNKFKTVYKSAIIGFAINAILDIPLMLLFHHFGLQPFFGAIIATIVGYAISITITLRSIKKDHDAKYSETFSTLGKMVIPTILMIIVVFILKMVIPYSAASKISCVIYVGVIAVIGAITYLIAAYKTGALSKVFGKEYINKIIKKLTFGKISLKNN